jgi:hypothetical protein
VLPKKYLCPIVVSGPGLGLDLKSLRNSLTNSAIWFRQHYEKYLRNYLETINLSKNGPAKILWGRSFLKYVCSIEKNKNSVQWIEHKKYVTKWFLEFEKFTSQNWEKP